MTAAHVTPIRAIAYFRKSNVDRGEKGASIEQQRAWANETAPREGVVLVAEFADQSIPGWDTARRVGFQNAIDFCREQARLGNPIEAVVCWMSSRFSRAEELETFGFLNDLREAGTYRMLTSTRWWDFTRREDLIVYLIEQMGNADYSRNLSRDVRRGKKTGARDGYWVSGKPPFGYTAEGPPRKRKLVPHPTDANTVRFLFDEYARRDTSLRGLARMMTDRGVSTPGGQQRWCFRTVMHVLENPLYTGDMVSGRRENSAFVGSVIVKGKGRKERKTDPGQWVRVPDAHPALVGREVFERVQAKLRANKRNTARGKGYVLTGLVRCGHCQGPMVGRTQRTTDARTGKTYQHRYFVCNNYNSHGKASGCNLNAVRERPLVSAVSTKLGASLADPDTVGRLRDEIRRQELAEMGTGSERELLARIADLDRKIKTGAERFLTAPEELVEACRQSLSALQEQRRSLAADLDALRARTAAVASLDERIEEAAARFARLAEVFERGDPVLVREALREVIERIELWFSHSTSGNARRTTTSFAKGLIYVRPECLPTSELCNAS
jgi:DNA invertase Pin-like site-specific DNA recombinase